MPMPAPTRTPTPTYTSTRTPTHTQPASGGVEGPGSRFGRAVSAHSALRRRLTVGLGLARDLVHDHFACKCVLLL